MLLLQNEYSFQCYWWVLQGSNLRPTACKAVALPTELNTPCQTRWRILTGGLPESIGNAPLADSGIHRTADPAGSDEAQSLWNRGSVVNAPCIHISGANRHGRATANGENRIRCRKFMFPVSSCLSIPNMTWGRLSGEIPALSTTLSTGWRYLCTTRVPTYPPPLANLSLGKVLPAC